MGEFFGFLKTKQFFIHFGLALISVFLIMFILIKSLSSYTNHGEYIEVPDFSNKRISELPGIIEDKGINYQIIDSIYDPAQQAGIVIKQDPYAKTFVKHNRIIYLYVTSMVPPQVSMPKLIDRSERQAKLILESYGLKLGKVIPKNADCNGCVLSQLNKGSEIEVGKAVKKGTVIDIVVGVKEAYVAPAADSLGNVNGETFDNGE